VVRVSIAVTVEVERPGSYEPRPTSQRAGNASCTASQAASRSVISETEYLPSTDEDDEFLSSVVSKSGPSAEFDCDLLAAFLTS
jgi:hypothetical protein